MLIINSLLNCVETFLKSSYGFGIAA